jgi:hypothetical protein
VSAPSPAGFRASPEGLLIPSTVERQREVWTRDETRLVDRAMKFLHAKGLRVVMDCPACKVDGLLKAEQLHGGDAALLCAHKARILSRAH